MTGARRSGPREAAGPTLEPSRRSFVAWLAARGAAGTFACAVVSLSERRIGHGFGSFGFSSLAILALGGFLIAGSFGFAWLAHRGASRRALGAPLVSMDLAVIAALVYLTGGATSVFASLFGVAVLLAALLLGPEAALVTTATALVLHVFTALGLSAGILPPPPDAPRSLFEISPLSLSIALSGHATALLVVGLLSRALAVRVRRAGGDVERAEASAKRLERLNASIIEGIGSGLVTLDSGGRVTSANPAALRIVGAEERGLEGFDARALLPLEGIDLPPPEAVRREGSAFRVDRADFPCGLTASRLSGEERDHTLVVFQDLTEMQRLRDAAERAERLASLGRIAASLAHEIRNPLGAISGSVQMVREGASLEEDDRKLLGIVSREVARLDDLVATMLAVSRPSEPERRTVDLRAIADDVVRLLERGPLASHAHRIVLRGPETVLATADDRQIRQMLWNLLKNALTATPEGGRVEIGVERTGDVARLVVDDSGPGVTAEMRARLFEPFYSGKPLGVGLGLSIVEQLARAHGGRVEALESPLGGARFVVEIPVRSEANR